MIDYKLLHILRSVLRLFTGSWGPGYTYLLIPKLFCMPPRGPLWQLLPEWSECVCVFRFDIVIFSHVEMISHRVTAIVQCIKWSRMEHSIFTSNSSVPIVKSKYKSYLLEPAWPHGQFTKQNCSRHKWQGRSLETRYVKGSTVRAKHNRISHSLVFSPNKWIITKSFIVRSVVTCQSFCAERGSPRREPFQQRTDHFESQ